MWQPPNNPDPFAILHEAAGDDPPEVALAKFLWFHKNALRIQPSLSGVRLSFALGYWLDLASRYKPAMDAYVRVRDETETSFRIEPASFDLFHDVASLNKHIDAGERTAKLFAEVAATDPDVARRLYHVAESHLIGIGEYKACGPFLETDKRIALAAKCYHMARQYEDSQPERDTPLPRFSRQHFIENVATLAALLVLNDRDTDAQDVYTKSLLVIDDDEFRSTMDAALTGHFPSK
ncbi:MAG: hypothetical protein R3C59_16830 [Planctomycetaceae bacterium]